MAQKFTQEYYFVERWLFTATRKGTKQILESVMQSTEIISEKCLAKTKSGKKIIPSTENTFLNQYTPTYLPSQIVT